MTLDCVVFDKNEIYPPVSFVYQIILQLWFITKRKFDLEDLYLDIKLYILIFQKTPNLDYVICTWMVPKYQTALFLPVCFTGK